MTMTVRELIEALEEQDPDAEVRFMGQPSWPFEYSISGPWQPEVEQPVCMAAIPGLFDGRGEPELCYRRIEREDGEWVHSDPELPRPHDAEPEDRTGFEPEGSPEVTPVYLVEGSQLGYGSKDAWS